MICNRSVECLINLKISGSQQSRIRRCVKFGFANTDGEGDGDKRNCNDGAYFCYCAYVLRISRYSGFLLVVLTNTGIFLRSLKLCRESRTKQVLLVSKKKIGSSHAFFRDS